MIALRSHLQTIIEGCDLWSLKVHTATPTRYEICYLMRVDARRWRVQAVCSVLVQPATLDAPDALERDLGGMIDALTDLQYNQ